MTFFFLLFTVNRQQPFIVSNQNKRLTFSVKLENKKESAYNTEIVVDFSENLFFASWSMPVREGTLVITAIFVVNYCLPSTQLSRSSVFSEEIPCPST